MSIPRQIHPDLKPIVRAAKAAGWAIERGRNNHLRFVAPDGRTFYTGSTPSDFRSARNFKARLRREAGLVV